MSDVLLKKVYTNFWNQKSVLTEAPALNQEPADPNFNFEVADKELAGVVSYLMGVPDVTKTPFKEAIEIVQKYYSEQPGWKKLLLDYLEYTIEKEQANLTKKENDIVKKIEEFTNQLLGKK